MQVLVCGGFYRTGSTWLFNLIKETVLASGATITCTGDTAPVECSTDYLLHKVHAYCPKLAARAATVFYSTRGIAPMCSSFERFTGYQLPHSYIAVYVESLNWLEASAYCLKFEDIYKDKIKIVNEVAAALSLSVDANAVLLRLDSIKPPTEMAYCPVSYLFRNHITNADNTHNTASSFFRRR
jgi:hypothetical protein